MMTAEPGGFVETSDGTLVHFIDLDLHAEALRTDVVDPILLIHGLGATGIIGHASLEGSHTAAVWSPSTSAAAKARPGGFDRDGARQTWLPTSTPSQHIWVCVALPSSAAAWAGQSRCSTRSTIRSTSADLSCWRHSPACRTR